MWKLLSGKQLSLCLRELHWPRVQQFWGPLKGSMTGLCHSPCHSLPAWVTLLTLSLPWLVALPLCLLLGLPQQNVPCASSRVAAISQQGAGGPWEQWQPAEQGKTLPEIPASITCCKNQPSWGLFLIASCLSAKNTTLSNQHWLRWQGATGKVALPASPCSNPYNQISKRIKTNRGCSQWCITFSVLTSTFYRSLFGQWNITRCSLPLLPCSPF